jgi:hypothetical protein
MEKVTYNLGPNGLVDGSLADKKTVTDGKVSTAKK